MVVMVDDQFDARPQSGLSGADVVWQAPAEGGIPRYMAFFQTGNPPAVGPVRSSRLYFIAWASEWRPLYVHAGGSPQAKALLASSKGRGSYVYNADEFRWGGGRLPVAGPHASPRPTTCTRTASTCGGWRKRVGAEPGRRTEAGLELRRRRCRSSSGRSGGGLAVPYLANKVSYKYDRASNTYRRSVTGEKKQTDAGTKTRIAPTNVDRHGRPLRAAQRRQPQEPPRGPGDGQRQGVDLDQRQDDPRDVEEAGFRGKTQFFDRNGNKVTLTRGQTFVQVVPLSAKITVTPGKAPTASTTRPIAVAGGPIGAVGRFIS